MRLITIILLLAGTLKAQAPGVGVIEFYGLRKLREADIRRVLGIREGNPLPPSKGQVEERLEAIPGVSSARLEAACCEDGQVVLYVGIQEKGSAFVQYRMPPETHVALPKQVVVAYASFLEALRAAASSGVAAEDLSRGHSLVADPKAQAAQKTFVDLAVDHFEELKTVLRTAESPEHRAIAAYVLAYTPNKSAVLEDLLFALEDPDETVRGNAIRSLGGFAVLAASNPGAGLKISPLPFISMLNSVVWTDRNNAATVLVNLTERRDRTILAELRKRALPALTEMARWKHLAHALPSYILVGRVAGLPEKELQDLWSAGKRETVIRKVARLK